MAGNVYPIFLMAEYTINDKQNVIVQLGHAGFTLGDFQVHVSPKNSQSSSTFDSNIRLELDDEAIVKADLSSRQANLQPEIRLSGIYFSIGIGKKF